MKLFFTPSEACCLTRYSKQHGKSRRGKHVKSGNIHFKRNLHIAFTILSDVRVIGRELILDEIRALMDINKTFCASLAVLAFNGGRGAEKSIKFSN